MNAEPAPSMNQSSKDAASAYARVTPVSIGQLRVLRIGAIELHLDGFQLKVHGKLVHLPMKEHQLLVLLMDNAGRALTRRYLLDTVWGKGYGDSNKTLDVHIKRLRTRLRSGPDDDPGPIRTVRGVGYIFDYTPED
ncbi:winged helix-turn-helix domain-containing protein [Fodinicola feengrottensis]|nr:winged helix-turn-helix domain-containing protein [Fodinicola feengrottensis]